MEQQAVAFLSLFFVGQKMKIIGKASDGFEDSAEKTTEDHGYGFRGLWGNVS